MNEDNEYARCKVALDRLSIGNMGVEFGTEASSINNRFGISFVLGGLTHENG